jgi:hypothetical protein
MDPVTTFWATVLGAAIGVLAGAFIQYIVDYLVHRRSKANQRSALKKELQYNLLVVGDLITEARNLRNSLNADSLPTYFGYLGYEKAFFTQANALLNGGQLYEWFSIADLKKLHKVSVCLNANNSEWVNKNISQRRDAAVKGEGYDKSEAGNFVKFVEDQISETQSILNDFIAIL